MTLEFSKLTSCLFYSVVTFEIWTFTQKKNPTLVIRYFISEFRYKNTKMVKGTYFCAFDSVRVRICALKEDWLGVDSLGNFERSTEFLVVR